MKVGLALGGGGARGFAHIGVLEVLEKERIPIDIISGTSMGAVVGALYARDRSVKLLKDKIFSLVHREALRELEEKFSPSQGEDKTRIHKIRKTFLFVKEVYLWNLRIVKKWLIDYKPFEVLFKEAVGNLTFSDCKIPFLCVATDLIEGEEVCLEEGLLYEALLASSALPGIFPPLKLNERFLVDGGVLGTLPVDSLREKKTDFIIGVSLDKRRRLRFLRSSLDIILSVDEIRYDKLNQISASKADFLLEPDTSDFGWADFSHIEEIIDKGREEAEAKITQLKKRLKHRRFFPFIKRPRTGP